MNIYQKSLFQAFFITLIWTLFFPIFFPFHLPYFAPFLIILYYRKTFLVSLWGSLACGLSIDLLAAKTQLGFYALNYTLVTSILFFQRKHFFGDYLSTLPIMVFFFGMLSGLIQALLLYVFEKQVALSWHWIANDLILIPAYSAILAFVFFILPWYLTSKQMRKEREFFIK